MNSILIFLYVCVRRSVNLNTFLNNRSTVHFYGGGGRVEGLTKLIVICGIHRCMTSFWRPYHLMYKKLNSYVYKSITGFPNNFDRMRPVMLKTCILYHIFVQFLLCAFYFFLDQLLLYLEVSRFERTSLVS